MCQTETDMDTRAIKKQNTNTRTSPDNKPFQTRPFFRRALCLQSSGSHSCGRQAKLILRAASAKLPQLRHWHEMGGLIGLHLFVCHHYHHPDEVELALKAVGTTALPLTADDQCLQSWSDEPDRMYFVSLFWRKVVLFKHLQMGCE